jgi:histidinol-phosphate aminotransferase
MVILNEVNMSKYWSNSIHKLQPYVPGEQVSGDNIIKLNTNESPYPPSPAVAAALADLAASSLKLYPDPLAADLRISLADNFNVTSNQVFVGNGSDDVLAMAFMAFFRGKTIQFPELTYSFYPVWCGLFNIDYINTPMTTDYGIDTAALALQNGGVIIANPNAPTGKLTPLATIGELATNSNGSVVIVDEAYIDFGGESAVSLIDQHDNILVVQTFSKSRSLAGLRLGYAIGHPDLIEGLVRVKDSFNSYPIDSVALACGKAAIEDNEYFEATCDKVIASREVLTTGLELLGFDVIPSSANFVFAQHKHKAAAELYQQLKDNNILVRYFNKPTIDNFLRITVGTDAEIGALLNTLKTII